MQKSLYDLLEVSASASPESITISYQRLHAKFAELQSSSEGEDATNHLIALREAYSTLSDTARRAAYDEKLAARAMAEQIPDSEPKSYAKVLLVLAVIGTFGFGYAKYQSNQAQQLALEREKAAAELRLAEIEAQRERYAAQQTESQREQEERRARYERERDIEYGRQISRDLQRQEASAQYEKQREEQRKLREEQQRQADAERRLAQDKATLRRMEAENTRRSYY